ncbi:hypothetical protein D3C81_772570 [compost metagenome]
MIEIERMSVDGLTKREWKFEPQLDSQGVIGVKLTSYSKQTRPMANGHKFVVANGQCFNEVRAIGGPQLSREEVPIPPDVVKAVQVRLVDQVKQAMENIL